MDFSVISRILELDPRNEIRDQLVVQAVSDELLGYLDRNLLSGEVSELAHAFDGLVYLREYPVREVFSVTDADTGKHLSVCADSQDADLSRIEAHQMRALRVNDPHASAVWIRYRYGYARDELPAPIKNVLVSVVKQRLIYGEDPVGTLGVDKVTDDFERLGPYKRVKVP